MTPEKVLFRTNDYIERQIEIIPKSEKQEKSKRENLDFALSIKSAIEKQIPKKPLLYKGYEGKCPTCGVIFLDRSTNYCGNCGQALDWGGSDEE